MQIIIANVEDEKPHIATTALPAGSERHRLLESTCMDAVVHANGNPFSIRRKTSTIITATKSKSHATTKEKKNWHSVKSILVGSKKKTLCDSGRNKK